MRRSVSSRFVVGLVACGSGQQNSSMEEGIATEFDCSAANEVWLPQSSSLPDPDLALTTMNSSLVAQFMVWLIENKSIDSFKNWYASGSRDSSVAEMHAAFDAAYSDSFNDIWQIALSTERRNFCFPLLECDAPPLTESTTLETGLDGRPAAAVLPESDPVLLAVESGESLNFVSCETASPLLSALFVDLPSPSRRNLWNSNGHRFAAHLVDWDGDRIPSKTVVTMTHPSISQLDSCSSQPVFLLNSWQDHVLLPSVSSQVNVTVDTIGTAGDSGLSAEVGDLPLYYPGPLLSLCGPCDVNGTFTCVELSNGSESGELITGYCLMADRTWI